MVKGDRSDVLKKVMDGPVLFEQMEARLDFTVLQNVPFVMDIGRLTCIRLSSVLQLKPEEGILDYCGRHAVLPWIRNISKSEMWAIVLILKTLHTTLTF